MAAPRLLTYFDVIQHAIDFLSGRGPSANQAQIRRAIQQSYRELAAVRDWSFLLKNGRIQAYAAETHTASYDHTGGAYERLVTLSGSTTPSWINDAACRINDLTCDVEDGKTSTTFTLDATMNPGADVASSSITIYPRWYILPADFMSMHAPATETSWSFGEYRPPSEILGLDRWNDTTGTLRYYTIQEAPDLYGSMALFPWPPADEDATNDFIYKRRPRTLRYTGHDASDYAGAITVTAGSDTVAGSGTSFSSDHVGSILRISSSSSRPTGIEGDNPYVEERSIKAVASATSLTLDAAVTTSRSSVKYVITDPVDIGQVAHNAFLRLVEKHLAILRNLKDRTSIELLAERELQAAKGADSRVRERRVAGIPRHYYRRLADAPTGTNNW